MRIGMKQICINPPFPVNRMLKEEKHQVVSDDLFCRIIVIDSEEDIPFYHISIDTVEIWKEREDRIQETIEQVVGKAIHCICSATHSHNCPCLTTDDAYVEFVIDRIKSEVGMIELISYDQVSYSYQYAYFDQVGKSRILDYTTPHIYAETFSIYGDGKRIATFLIHNVHPTIRELHVGDFTAEYPGYCIRKLSEEYPNEFFTFLLGPAGDISPHFVRKGRDDAEMLRLSELLRQEFDRQLLSQRPSQTKPMSFKYEEITIPNPLEPLDLNKLVLPESLNEDEIQCLNRFQSKDKDSRPHRTIRTFERCSEHHLAHLIFSDEYSMIFEPFELYSEYYGAVDKQKCSIISISKGFDHYLTGLYLSRLSMHGSFSEFSPQTKKRMWEILNRWSCQEKA